MSPYWVAGVGGAAAAVALAWPYIPKLRPSALSPSDRAWWVNRLFSLASAADEAGETLVASSARALIASLVNQQEPAKRGGR